MAQALIRPETTVPVLAPLVDPALVREDRQRFYREEIPELAHANAFYAPSGRWPARGWILVRRGDYDGFNKYATNLQLQIDDFASGTLTFKNLAIVQARCVSRGIATDPNAVYLVELTDSRGILSNSWGQWPTTSQYNILAPAYPEQFYSQTLDGVLPWAWDRMVGDLWGQMPLLGAFPGLPVTVSGTPEGFSFPGVPCWPALCDVLDLLGMVVSYNPTAASPYSIKLIGAADSAFDAITARFANRLQEDLEYIDSGAGRIAGQVVVYFHRRNQYYGTEETVRRDALQWQTDELYAVVVTATATLSSSPGVAFLWDDFCVRYDINGIPLAADVITAAALAQERASQYYAVQYRGTDGYLKQTYAGALPLYAGTVVDGVCWLQERSLREGWKTTIVRGPQPAWPILARSGT